MSARRRAAFATALILAGCASAPPPAVPDAPALDDRDCAALAVAVAGLEGHVPPLRLRPLTEDLSAVAEEMGVGPPEPFSPDAAPDQVRQLGEARDARRGERLRIACAWADPAAEGAPFPADRGPGDGGAEAVLQAPAYSADGRFAVVDLMVLVGRPPRRELRRHMLTAPAGRWDTHRMEFGAQER